MIKKLLLLVVLFNLNSVVFSQNDSIRVSNNDLLIGELKEMSKSILTFDTPYADKDFKIKWSKVSEVYSTRTFIISLSNGDRFNSSIKTDPTNKENVIVVIEGVDKSVHLSDVVFLEPVAASFFSRLEADFDIGLTLTKTNNLRSVTTNFALKYLAYKWDLGADFNLVYSEQDNVDNINQPIKRQQ